MNVNKYHFYYWLFHYSFVVTLDLLDPSRTFNIYTESLMIFTQLCIFYSFLFVLIWFKRNNIKAILKSLALFIFSFSFVVFLAFIRGRIFAHYGYELYGSFRQMFIDATFRYVGFALYAVGCYFIMRYGAKQKQLRQLAEQQAAKDIAAAQLAAHNAKLAANNAQLAASNAQMRQEVLELENNFLRAQINPHFLYNTLNTFYAKALPLSQELADAIITLAGIMRYSLQMEQHGQLTALKMEVAHLERVIAMHRLRFGNKCHINFTVEGPCEQYKVVPLIFITLLENAIKYGAVDDPTDPVTLQVSAKGPYIQFFIRNKKMGKPPQPSHGIGLHNIRKRLTHVYGTQYQLNINDTATHYQVLLDIEYKESENIEP